MMMTGRGNNDRVTPGRFGEPDGVTGGPVAPVVVGQSPAMRLVIDQADAVANTDSTVLITGESGVGKDVLARYIHFKSRRVVSQMHMINCGAFTQTLFEAEFFGHEKGAFTGAVSSRIGLLEAADGSTLFLDEVGDLDPLMQVKLLRFLEDGSFRRVGSVKDRRVNVRIIAATNKDLDSAVRTGKFRADLFYRLNVITLLVPPLRERREEIPELAEMFLTSLRSRMRRPHLKLSHEARRRLQDYNWPGNVRELRNCLERACTLSTSDMITEDELAISTQGALHLISRPVPVENIRPLSLVGSGITLARLERAHIEAVLAQCGGNRERAAAVLGISSRTLYRKLKEYGLDERAEQVA